MTVIIKQISRLAQPAIPSRRQLLLLLCVSVPSFMINLDANIVAVSLPSIARTLNADFAATEGTWRRWATNRATANSRIEEREGRAM